MYIWQTSLLIFIIMGVIGLVLRAVADAMIGNTKSWTKDSKFIMKDIFKENPFLGILLCIEGLVGNLALLCFIVGIPLYFIFHI